MSPFIASLALAVLATLAVQMWIPRRERIAKALDEVLMSSEMVVDELRQYRYIIEASDAYTLMTRLILIDAIEELQRDLLTLKAARGYTYREGGDPA